MPFTPQVVNYTDGEPPRPSLKVCETPGLRSYPFISRHVIKTLDLPGPEKLLYIVLRSFQDAKTGRCQPTKEQLQRACGGCVENSLLRWRSSLKQKGYLDWTQTPNRCLYSFPYPPI